MDKTVRDIQALTKGKDVWWMKATNWLFIIDSVVYSGNLNDIYTNVENSLTQG